MPTSLREKRTAFTFLLCKLITKMVEKNPGWSIALDECKVFQLRRGRDPRGTMETFTDLVHIPNSKHYMGLAADLNLYIDGEYVADGGHPAWKKISAEWKGMSPECTWGGDFKIVDSNHLSFGER